MKWLFACALAAFVAVVSHGAEMADTPAPAAAVDAPDAPEPKLDGVVVKRADGTYMTVTMDGPAMALRFFNAKKAPIAPNKTNGVVRFQFPSRTQEQRVLTVSADGKSLTHGRPLRPPFIFKAFITLTVGEGDSSPESYTVNYP